MFNFNFYTPTRVVFGKETEYRIGKLVKNVNCKKVLLHYGSGSVIRSGLLGRIKESLDASGVTYVELGGVVPNPRLSLVRKGIELCRKEGVDFLLAIGGGSVIDSAKAIGYGLANDGDVWDFYEHTRQASACLPIGVVLTIAASGSEMSNSSVITNDETLEKRGYNNDLPPCICCHEPGDHNDSPAIPDSLRLHRYSDAYHGALFHKRRKYGDHRCHCGRSYAHRDHEREDPCGRSRQL